jgi:predicted enzyme related to lactoylglutathione lyase
MTKIRGLVIYTKNLDQMKSFYEALGFEMREEQHKEGPLHYSCNAGEIWIEIYPREDYLESGKIRLELSVEDLLDKMEEAVSCGGTILRGPKLREGGYFLLLADPDGNSVALQQEISSSQSAS